MKAVVYTRYGPPGYSLFRRYPMINTARGTKNMSENSSPTHWFKRHQVTTFFIITYAITSGTICAASTWRSLAGSADHLATILTVAWRKAESRDARSAGWHQGHAFLLSSLGGADPTPASLKPVLDIMVIGPFGLVPLQGRYPL